MTRFFLLFLVFSLNVYGADYICTGDLPDHKGSLYARCRSAYQNFNSQNSHSWRSSSFLELTSSTKENNGFSSFLLTQMLLTQPSFLKGRLLAKLSSQCVVCQQKILFGRQTN